MALRQVCLWSSLILCSLWIPDAYGQPLPGQSGFWCNSTSNPPLTVYQDSQGGQELWIKWVSDYFSGSGWTPTRRCAEVSQRLEDYRVRRELDFVTIGVMNNQPVICTATQDQGPCVGLIYTLKPDQDPIATLNQFFAWREGQAGLPSLLENAEIPYIDVRSRIEYESNSSVPAVQPPRPQNDLREL